MTSLFMSEYTKNTQFVNLTKAKGAFPQADILADKMVGLFLNSINHKTLMPPLIAL